MKINLLDPGLSSLTGHHFDLDLRLFRTLERRGHEVVVHGFINQAHGLELAAKAAGMQLSKTFRVHPYSPIFNGRTPHEGYRSMEEATAMDLANVEASDLWFWPSLTPYQLAAGLKAGMAMQQIGGTWWLPRIPLGAGARSWAASAKRLVENSSNFLVGAYDELLCLGCRTYSSGLTIHRLPCPHDGAPNDRRPETLKIIGFFGHQRQGRGIDIIPQLVDALLRQGFDVVIQDSGGTLRAKKMSQHLRFLEFIDDFAAEIARCDAIVWPSRWKSYTHSWSGVVSESIATGVPVIVPSGCIPAEMVARYEAGTFFHDFSAEAILAAIDDAVEHYPALLAAARAAAKEWRACNGTERLVEWLENHSGTIA